MSEDRHPGTPVTEAQIAEAQGKNPVEEAASWVTTTGSGLADYIEQIAGEQPDIHDGMIEAGLEIRAAVEKAARLIRQPSA